MVGRLSLPIAYCNLERSVSTRAERGQLVVNTMSCTYTNSLGLVYVKARRG